MQKNYRINLQSEIIDTKEPLINSSARLPALFVNDFVTAS